MFIGAYNKIVAILVKKGVRERNKIPSKSITDITGKNLIDKIRMTRVTETNTKLPITNELGVMQIRFKFLKFRAGKQPLSETRTGRSNKMFFPASNKLGFDLCIQRAMAQNIPFSPDEIIIEEISYFYWIPIEKTRDRK